MWKEIVEARPSDYFKPGALHLLEQFCEIMVVQRDALVELSCATVGDEPGRLTAAVRVVKDLGTVLTTTATKLRITVQGDIDRKSAQRHETEPQLESGGHLLGGGPRPVN